MALSSIFQQLGDLVKARKPSGARVVVDPGGSPRRGRAGKKKKKKRRKSAPTTLAQLRNFTGGGLRAGPGAIIRRGSPAPEKGRGRQVPPTKRDVPPRARGRSRGLGLNRGFR